MAELKEKNYMGILVSTSRKCPSNSTISEDHTCVEILNEDKLDSSLKATELRLAIPGLEFQAGDPKNCQLSSAKQDEELLFYVLDGSSPVSQMTGFSGQKRGFSVAMMDFSEKKCGTKSEVNALPNTAELKEGVLRAVSQEQICVTNSAPPAKPQVIGWPPIRSFRRNTLTTITKNTDVKEEKMKRLRTLHVKVSMDGAPYLRKVNLGAYTTYQDLALGLEKMFSCFMGKHISHGAAGREIVSESKIKDVLHGCEYVLTYEDKDDDLMLLGDVPWEMFVDTCKKLRIMKGP